MSIPLGLGLIIVGSSIAMIANRPAGVALVVIGIIVLGMFTNDSSERDTHDNGPMSHFQTEHHEYGISTMAFRSIEVRDHYGNRMKSEIGYLQVRHSLAKLESRRD